MLFGQKFIREQLKPSGMANDQPDAPKLFGIRPSVGVMELVCEIGEFRQLNNQTRSSGSDPIRIYPY